MKKDSTGLIENRWRDGDPYLYEQRPQTLRDTMKHKNSAYRINYVCVLDTFVPNGALRNWSISHWWAYRSGWMRGSFILISEVSPNPQFHILRPEVSGASWLSCPHSKSSRCSGIQELLLSSLASATAVPPRVALRWVRASSPLLASRSSWALVPTCAHLGTLALSLCCLSQ